MRDLAAFPPPPPCRRRGEGFVHQRLPSASFPGPRNKRARRLNVGDGDTFSPVFSAGGPVGKNRLRRSGHTWRSRGRRSLPRRVLRGRGGKPPRFLSHLRSHRAKKKKDATLEDPLPGAFPHLSPLRRPSPALPPAAARGLQCRKQNEAFAGTYLLPPGESDRPGSSFSHGRLPRPCSSASLSSSNRRILEVRGAGQQCSGRARSARLGSSAQTASPAPWKASGAAATAGSESGRA